MDLIKEAERIIYQDKVKIVGYGQKLTNIESCGIPITFPTNLEFDLGAVLRQLKCICKECSLMYNQRLCSYKLAAIKKLYENKMVKGNVRM